MEVLLCCAAMSGVAGGGMKSGVACGAEAVNALNAEEYLFCLFSKFLLASFVCFHLVFDKFFL